ncbi:glycosyltransferase family 4 protein [Croceitalea sp. MTPC9]|uniref:glycosyltransferase family 4 protein n=1 Tax=unclassified Croceitalea TaxID=2632280 RepID=UPI002B386D2F|nr:glycosyltransferase family 4 protein [Croceitalea sp. MTPC6]GMN15855.1 glycosyltransferase family 4 protein [Croceitalea sp. MTPC9]
MQKVLIIAYYWPPAGGPGVQRWLKFVKYLCDFDLEPVVYIPENPNYPITDASLVNEIPKGIQVLKQPIFEPYGLASIFSKKKTKRISSGIIQKYKKQSVLERLLLWVRGNFFIPDARKYWVKPSVKYLLTVIEAQGIQTVITTGPPHSVHLIGLGLKKQKQISWITDFRDPWTSIGYHKKLKLTKSSRKKHKQLEAQVLSTADKIVVTSNTTKEEFLNITPKPIKVITNGYDNELNPLPLDEKFTISHIGSLLTDRNPTTLWKVLNELLVENKGFKESLQIQLVGVVGQEVLESLKNFGLLSFVSNLGYVSHEEVLQLQQKSQVLLLLEIDSKETKGILPGKLFEYLNSKRPILAIGPQGWEAAQIIKDTSAGHASNTKEESELKNVLLEWFENYKKGKLVSKSQDIEKYHRKELTNQLAKFIRWESS